jgi:hypothetical protein
MLRNDSSFAFTWSGAVKGFVALLLLQSKTSGVATLAGERGSLAAALDSAISKQPMWLCDLFGTEANGDARAKRILLRENPERKRPGPVRISFHSKFLTPEDISIFVDDTKCDTQESRTALCERFFAAWHRTNNDSGQQPSGEVAAQQPPSCTPPPHPSREEIPPKRMTEPITPLAGTPFADPFWVDTLTSIIREEVTTMLSDHTIFCPDTLRDELTSLYTSAAYRAVAAKGLQLTSDIDLNLGPSARLGVYETESCLKKFEALGRPLTIALASTLVPSLALLSFLQHERRIPLRVNYRYAHSLEIIRGIERDDYQEAPDAIIMGLIPAVTFLSQRRRPPYRPLMIMPKASNRLVVPRDARANDGARYVLPSDSPTSASFILDSMLESGKLTRKMTTIEHLEPDEILVKTQRPGDDFRSILWFPHYQLNQLLHGCQLSQTHSHAQDLPTILLVHEKLMYNVDLVTTLDIALRDAWLSLRVGGARLDRVMHRLVSDPEYLELFTRYTGLYAFDEDFLQRAKEKLHACG